MVEQVGVLFVDMEVVSVWVEDKEKSLLHSEPAAIMTVETIQKQISTHSKFLQVTCFPTSVCNS